MKPQSQETFPSPSLVDWIHISGHIPEKKRLIDGRQKKYPYQSSLSLSASMERWEDVYGQTKKSHFDEQAIRGRFLCFISAPTSTTDELGYEQKGETNTILVHWILDDPFSTGSGEWSSQALKKIPFNMFGTSLSPVNRRLLKARSNEVVLFSCWDSLHKH